VKLKTELLVLAWRNKRTSRAAVRVEIEKMLDAGLPEKYTAEIFEQKCGRAISARAGEIPG
jgi:type I restriction enzyme, R subunit